MTDWTSGYVADIGYTFGYYTELNPLRIKLAFLNNGLAYPEVGAACELGFGQGLSTNLHAAASVVQWHGTDFNPAQAGFAQELASVSGGGAQLTDDAFAEFAQRQSLPDFDFIGLHGIWSWISDQNRAVIVDFIRRKLKVGGVLYISYNTLPGWAAFAPMRHLLTEHAEVIGAQGRGIVNRINDALDFAAKLMDVNTAYARANPQIADRVKKLKEQNRHYLAHEYFNRDWHPMHFATMAQWLEPAKLQFACSANLTDHIDHVNLTPEQQALLAEFPDPMFRQSVRDFIVNQQFRKDYWVKGARKMSPLEQMEALRQQRVQLVLPAAEAPAKISTPLGELTLSPQVYPPLVAELADFQPRSLGELEQRLAPQGLNFSQVLQAAYILAGTGAVAPVQDSAQAASQRPYTERLNAHLRAKARASGEIAYLASPVTAGGVAVGRFEQLFMEALNHGQDSAAQLANHVWQIVSAQGHTLLKQGARLETREQNLAELEEQAQAFLTKRVPILKALQVL